MFSASFQHKVQDPLTSSLKCNKMHFLSLIQLSVRFKRTYCGLITHSLLIELLFVSLPLKLCNWPSIFTLAHLKGTCKGPSLGNINNVPEIKKKAFDLKALKHLLKAIILYSYYLSQSFTPFNRPRLSYSVWIVLFCCVETLNGEPE